MNNKIKIIVVLLLIVSLCVVMTSCSMFGPKVLENEDDPNNNNNNDDDDDDDDDDEENTIPNHLQAKIDQLLTQIRGINSMEGYIGAFATLFESIPINSITPAIGGIVGEDKAELVEEYYGKGMQAIGMINLVLPMLPYINTVLQFIEYSNSSNPLIAAAANGVLTGFGITKNGNTYSYTYGSTVYYLQKNGAVYSISFNDRTILFEYSNNNYKITENGIKYDIQYNETNIALVFVVTNVDEQTEMYSFESVKTGDNFAVQIHDVENNRLAQMLTNVELLEVTVSLQVEDFVVESIIGTLPADFATLGEIFIINEGVVSAFLPEIA